MSWLTTNCPVCGTIDVPVAKVVLRVRDAAGDGVCVIRCPSCDVRFTKAADAAMTVLLLAVGIEVSVWPVGSRDSVAHRAPITHDELEGFRALLADDERLRAGLVSL